MLVSYCGSQKTGASDGAFRGSAGKSQPPVLTDFIGYHLGIGIGSAERFEIIIVIIIATQPFPSEIGCGEIIDMIVLRGHAPLGCIWRHRVPSSSV